MSFTWLIDIDFFPGQVMMIVDDDYRQLSLLSFFHSGGADLYKDNVRTCVCLCVLTLNLAEFLKIRTNEVLICMFVN